jgi:5-methylthioadenosine/S-adenosylhomocysteine deaminase
MTTKTLLTNAIVITMDDDYHVYEPGAVAVNEDQLIAIGNERDLLGDPAYADYTKFDCLGKIVMPGLINTHTHVPMTLLRGLADDLRLDVWLMGYMMPVEREFVSPEFVRLGTLLACAEMIRSGITCFADMYYYEDSIAEATSQAGMRAVCGQTVMKFPTPDAHYYEEAIASAREFIIKWKGHPLITPSIAPHAPYTCPPEIIRDAVALAVEYDVPLHIHISETAQEVENMRADQGMPVVPYVKKLNLFDAKVIAAHCVHIDEGEIRSLVRAGAGIAHNPTSNLKLASGVAPVKRMLELGAKVGIGTDGPASNNDLDMFEEMRLTAILSKGFSGDPTALPARLVLTMATRLGAQALHLGKIAGSLEPGKRADLILIDIAPLHNSPRFRHDPNGLYSQIIYASKATDVSDVMINGRWVLQNYQLMTIDEKSLLSQAADYAHRIDAFLIEREQSVLSKLIAIGGTMEEESFEVQVKINQVDLIQIAKSLSKPGIEILRKRHYHQYDTYFEFENPSQGRLRYREDELLENGKITTVRSRLTLLGLARERSFPQKVLLSRSRYLAPATQSLRFYHEYFKPLREYEIEKDRERYLIHFHDTEFFVNLDHMIKPALGDFLEIKSRTWSRQDAERKSGLLVELIEYLGASPQATMSEDYIEISSSAME